MWAVSRQRPLRLLLTFIVYGNASDFLQGNLNSLDPRTEGWIGQIRGLTIQLFASVVSRAPTEQLASRKCFTERHESYCY